MGDFKNSYAQAKWERWANSHANYKRILATYKMLPEQRAYFENRILEIEKEYPCLKEKKQ